MTNDTPSAQPEAQAEPVASDAEWRAAVDRLAFLRPFLIGWKASDASKRNDMEAQVEGWISGIDDLYRLYDESAATPTAPQVQPPADTLCQQLQQRCSDWGVYWRASDAHGVDLTLDQALELLRDALGVEVEIKAAAQVQPVDERAAFERVAIGLVCERVALRRMLDDVENLPLHAHKRKVVRDWIAAAIAQVEAEAARSSLSGVSGEPSDSLGASASPTALSAPAADAASAPIAGADTLELLRQEQAAAVMPLIGPLLDAWDGVPNDVAGDEGLAEVRKHIKRVARGMEHG
jgi:hypothetical protein